MLITEKIGNLKTSPVSNKKIDALHIEWYETNKRVLHKQTKSGINITLKFLNENPNFKDEDILWQHENLVIAIEIIPAECIVIKIDSIKAAAAISYEIGNRHVPLFYSENELLIPYEVPIFNLLEASGFKPKIELRKLTDGFKTSVLPHLQVAGSDSLFNKINQPAISS